MSYIAEVGEKISLEVTYHKYFEYATHYTYYGESHRIYKFSDAEGNVLIWDTQSYLADKKYVDEYGMSKPIFEGATLKVTATIKAHKEYKGEEQTVLNRPKFTLIEQGKSPEEVAREKEDKRKKKQQYQLATIGEKDFVWNMPYRQYKQHYADCETVYNSYDANNSTISVIIREGRMKNSGVRGKHYHTFIFRAYNSVVSYKAISEETARKRLVKDFPEVKHWELDRILG